MDYIDLHCHFLPNIDDGTRSYDEAIALLRGLRRAGFGRVVATPHIRTAMFENRRAGLESSRDAFEARAAHEQGLPERGLGAEHFCDELFWRLFEADDAVPYPGKHAILIELPADVIPSRLESMVFEMRVRGVTPVLAHPERYAPLYNESAELERLVDAGVLPLLDVMSLSDRYGRAPRKAAERMLDEGLYYAACSDSHKAADAELTADAIGRLRRIVGRDEADDLLGEHPRRILSGAFEGWVTASG